MMAYVNFYSIRSQPRSGVHRFLKRQAEACQLNANLNCMHVTVLPDVGMKKVDTQGSGATTKLDFSGTIDFG